MRRLIFLPLLVFAVACNDSTLVQPENDLTIAADARAARTVVTWQEVFDQSYAGESFTTPSGVLHMWGIENGFNLTGDLEGYSLVYGRCQINLNSGEGGCGSITISYAIDEYLSAPVDGGFECAGHTEIEGFPAALVQRGYFDCKGTGYFEGLHMKAQGTNENLPAYQMTGEIW
jgi:hypothetical protein